MNKPLGRIGKAIPTQNKRSHREIRRACETLEARRLLAHIAGLVYHDVNANGQRDPSEGLQSGFQVYIDVNRNAVHDEGEPISTSDGFGNWSISNVPAGNHVVRMVERAGFTRKPQTPASGAYFVNVTHNDQVTTGLDFGISRYASAKGRIFFDVNGDGTFNGADTPMSGIRVYVDSNNNGVYDPGELSKLTNADGEYRIDYIYPGINTIRIEKPADQRFSTRGEYRQLFYSNRRSENLNFGLTNTGTISGHIWSDLNGDYFQSPDEPDLAGRMVWLDHNQNGVRDANEAAVLTDANGNYTFTDLKPGGYIIAASRPNGTQSTVPLNINRREVQLNASQHLTGQDFAFAPLGKIRGVVFGDDNNNGLYDFNEQGLPGRKVYLDLNGDAILQPDEPVFFTNTRGEYQFTDLPTGTYLVRVIPPAGQVQTFPEAGQLVDVQAGEIEWHNDFGLTMAGQIRGIVFSDRNGNGTFDPDEPALKWRRVFIDANNNGLFDVGETSAVTDVNGNYVFNDLRPGAYVVRAVPVPGTRQTVPASGQYVLNVRGGMVINNRNFGFAQPASFSGLVFNDLNGNGVQDPGENGAANITVYIDVNNNGTRGPNEPFVRTAADGTYTISNFRPGNWVVRVEVPAGQAVSVPSAGFYSSQFIGGQHRNGFDFGLFDTGSISGTVFNDLNGNGVQDGGETALSGRTVFIDANSNGVLDPGETSVITDGSGAYIFSALGPGTYRVTVETDPTEIITAPGAGFYDVPLASGGAVSGRNFGIASGTISGFVYDDDNGNGAQDGGETGRAGIRVYIDENNNDTFDVGEESVFTDVDGNYVFSNLDAGTYTVRIVPLPGETITQPVAEEYVINLALGQHSANNIFGVEPIAPIGATISGRVFDDNDTDGTFSGGDTPIVGRRVFIDTNGNGIFDGGVDIEELTDASGSYAFGALADDTYEIFVELDTVAGETLIAPLAGSHTVIITGGADDTDNDFAIDVP